MNGWIQDVRYGIRMLLKGPGTTATAIIALALGIGLTTTMFSIVQGVILRGLPFEESDRIVSVGRFNPMRGQRGEPAPLHDYADWRDQQRSFEELAAFTNTSVTASGGGVPERYRGARITPNALKALRVAPELGRSFSDDDTRAGAPPVVLISHLVWVSRYGQRTTVLGEVLRLNGTPATIVGVLPAGFAFPESQDVWMPLESTLSAQRSGGGSVEVFGRLKPGVTEAAAAADMALIAKRLADRYPENKDQSATVEAYVRRHLPSRIVTTLFTMLAAVLGVMLIACVNVTNLQMARAAERAKEIAVRTALGSGSWRIVRQLLAEGLLLSLVGALLGLGIAQFGVTWFSRAIAGDRPPFWIDVRLDPAVLLFATMMSVAAALVSSLLPGWRVARADPNAVLKDDGRGTTSLRMGRLSRSLIVVEVTVSCILLVVSGLMIRSIVKTSRLDYPFETNVFVARFAAETAKYPASEDVARLVDRLDERLRRVGGIQRLAFATGAPGSSGGSRTSMSIDGVAYASGSDRPAATRVAVSPEYFGVLGVSGMQGRMLSAGDGANGLPVAVVGEDFAKKFLPQGAIGRRIQFGDAKQPWWTIVGVVPTLGVANNDGRVFEMAYVPLAQLVGQPQPPRNLTMIAAAGADPAEVTSAVRVAAMEIDDNMPITQAGTLDAELWQRGWPFRVFGGLFLTFGFAALVLAAVGLYGVMAFSVRRRTQEIGVRMALGASRRGVMGMLLWQGMWRVVLGVALGLVPGWFVGTRMTALLANVGAADPVVHGATVVTLIVAGFAACLVPAHRAASVDPLVALRE